MHPKQLFLHKLMRDKHNYLEDHTSDVESSTSIVLPSAMQVVP